MSALDVRIAHPLGAFRLDVAFASQARLVALFGRSGAGKTSVVHAIAGLVRPKNARIVVGGEVWVDTATGVFVPAQHRRVGYVFQEGRLFPHLSVRGNLVYGRRFARRDARDAVDFDAAVELLGLAALLERRPAALSGGEAQRVAIGRALLARPALLLMDEPLASLDEPRKAEILPTLERLRDEVGVPIVYVSHSIAEVARLAQEVIVLSDGRVVATGAPTEVMSRLDLFPITGRAEAGAVLDARVAGHDAAEGLTSLDTAAGVLRVPRIDAPVGAALRARIRARDVMLATAAPRDLSALNALVGRVVEMGHPGDADDSAVVDVRVMCGSQALLARLTRHSIRRLGIAPGREVWAVIKAVAFDGRALGRPGRTRTGADAEGL